MPLTQRGTTKIIIQQNEEPSSYNSEGDSSRHEGRAFYPSDGDGDWEDEDEDELQPSDSASASNEAPTLHARAPRTAPRQAPRRHRLPRTQAQFAPVRGHAPIPPSSVEQSDEYAQYGRGGYAPAGPGGYYGARGPAPGYPQNHHVAPYAGYGGANQMVPYGNYGNPFSPMSNGSSGASYFGDPHHRGMYDAPPYHQAPGYYGAHQLPQYMQQFHLSPPPPAPTEIPGQSTTPAPHELAALDKEKMRMEAELAAFKAQEDKLYKIERERQLEIQIREDAENNLRQRMEDMRRAQDEARKEIQRAKIEAERETRERIETERRNEEERNKAHAAAMARVEENTRKKFEAEMRIAEDRRQREEEDRKISEEAARIRFEVAVKKAGEEKAAAEKKAAEDIERMKLIQEDAKRIAEAEARAKFEKEKAEEIAKADAAEAAKKEAEALKKRIQDETKAKLEEAARKGTDKSAPIQFTDALGRKFSFPFHICSSWQGMEDLIKQAFQQVDIIGPHVMEGHYDLSGPNNEIILPSVWERVIQPAWTVKMTMWPIEKSPPLSRPGLHGMGRHMHGMPHPQAARMGDPFHIGMAPAGRRPGGGIPVPPPPGWPRGGGGGLNIPTNINVVDANPRKSSKSKSKQQSMGSLFFGKPAKKKGHKK